MSKKQKPGCIFDLTERIYFSTGDWLSKQMHDKELSSSMVADSITGKRGESCTTAYISNIKAGRESLPARLADQFLDAFNYTGNERKHYQSEFARIHLPLELRGVVHSPLRSIKSIMEKEQTRISCGHQFMETDEYKELIDLEKINLNKIENIKNKYIERYNAAKTKFDERKEDKINTFVQQNEFSIRRLATLFSLSLEFIIKRINNPGFEYFNFSRNQTLSHLVGHEDFEDYRNARNKVREINKNNNTLIAYDLTKTQLNDVYTALEKFSKIKRRPLDSRYSFWRSIYLEYEFIELDFESSNFNNRMTDEIQVKKDYVESLSRRELFFIQDVMRELVDISIDNGLDCLDSVLNNLQEIMGFDYSSCIKSYKELSNSEAIIPDPYYDLFNYYLTMNQPTTDKNESLDINYKIETVDNFTIFGFSITELLNTRSNDIPKVYEKIIDKAIEEEQSEGYDLMEEQDFRDSKINLELQQRLPRFYLDELLGFERIKKNDFGGFLISEISGLI